MIYTDIETKIVADCTKNMRFSLAQDYVRLEHVIVGLFNKYKYEKFQVISEQRVKDLIARILEIKDKEKLWQLNERMRRINEGDKDLHLKILEKFKDIYGFSDNDLMKLSCWLTQVKRTAHDLEIEAATALVFYSSEQYTGKSTLMTMIKKAVLSSYQKKVVLRNFSIDDIFTRFRPMELLQDLVITIDEIGYISKDKSAQIKSLITDTNAIGIEEKYKNVIRGRKLANFIITTNKDPLALFYGSAHERRLSIIENFKIVKKMTQKDLYAVVDELWQSATIEYAFDTKKLLELNLNRVRSNDEVFEALVRYYDDYSKITVGSVIKKGGYTVAALYKEFRKLEYEVSKELISSYLDTTKEYFEVRVSKRLRRYYFTDKLMEDLESESQKLSDEKG